MSFGNTRGNFRTTLAADMAAHDRAPPLLRQIGNYAVEYYSSEQLLVRWLELMFDQTEVQAAVQLVRFIARRDLARTAQFYGPAHPEARPA